MAGNEKRTQNPGETTQKPGKAPVGAQDGESSRFGRLGRDVQAKISSQLRAIYEDVVNKGGIPARFVDLLRRLDPKGEESGEESFTVNETLSRTRLLAETVFGDAEFAKKWLTLPNPALDDRIPIQMAETDAGAREVEVILTRIAHGVYS